MIDQTSPDLNPDDQPLPSVQSSDLEHAPWCTRDDHPRGLCRGPWEPIGDDSWERGLARLELGSSHGTYIDVRLEQPSMTLTPPEARRLGQQLIALSGTAQEPWEPVEPPQNACPVPWCTEAYPSHFDVGSDHQTEYRYHAASGLEPRYFADHDKHPVYVSPAVGVRLYQEWLNTAPVVELTVGQVGWEGAEITETSAGMTLKQARALMVDLVILLQEAGELER